MIFQTGLGVWKGFMINNVTFSLMSQRQKLVFTQNVCIVKIEYIPKVFVDERYSVYLFAILHHLTEKLFRKIKQ